mmetsp:Transcript_29182/g.82128  ORF Transcript_29182/g.82128 Transcript_29182/m.82128 type:complete len:241 (+) Transcript_29182:60-782(+)
MTHLAQCEFFDVHSGYDLEPALKWKQNGQRKSRQCVSFMMTGGCKYREACTFAHSEDRLTPSPPMRGVVQNRVLQSLGEDRSLQLRSGLLLRALQSGAAAPPGQAQLQVVCLHVRTRRLHQSGLHLRTQLAGFATHARRQRQSRNNPADAGVGLTRSSAACRAADVQRSLHGAQHAAQALVACGWETATRRTIHRGSIPAVRPSLGPGLAAAGVTELRHRTVISESCGGSIIRVAIPHRV